MYLVFVNSLVPIFEWLTRAFFLCLIGLQKLRFFIEQPIKFNSQSVHSFQQSLFIVSRKLLFINSFNRFVVSRVCFLSLKVLTKNQQSVNKFSLSDTAFASLKNGLTIYAIYYLLIKSFGVLIYPLGNV